MPPSETYTAAPTFTRSAILEPSADELHIRSQSPSPEDRPALNAINLSVLTTSTQSVVREGKVVAIRDSDEEDSDSLASLGDIFGRRKDEGAKTASTLDDPDAMDIEKEGNSMLKLFLNGRSDPATSKKKLRDILAMKSSGSRNATKYLDRQRDHVEDTRKIEQLRTEYEFSLQEADNEEPTGDLDDKLEHLMEGDGNAEKLIGAVRRTEALSQEMGYSFFGRLGMRDFVARPMPVPQFPSKAVPFQLFRPWDDEMRTRQYLCGIMAQLAGSGNLKNDALKWTYNAFCTEPRIAVRAAYVNTLENAASHWVRNGVKPHDVQLCFYTLAADMEEMADSVKFSMRPLPVKIPALKPDYLVSTLDLFAKIASHMSFEALSVLASLVCQIAIDSALMDIASVASAVETLFDNILGRYCDEEVAYYVASHIVSNVPQALQEPTLQERLLEHIRPTSLCAIHVRVTLAHLFLLGIPARQPIFNASRPPNIDLTSLTNLLTTSDDFATGRLRTKLNYTDLRARTCLLDIAISDGGRPASFPTVQYPRTRDFNQGIDNIAAAVRKVWTAIADTGATHMRRTEAKEKLDCLYQRLIYIVRTEPPPKKHLFDRVTGRFGEGDEVRAVARGRDQLKSFLARASEARMNTPVVKFKEEEDVILPTGSEEKQDGDQQMLESGDQKENSAPREDLLSPPPPPPGIRKTPSTVSSDSAVFVDAVEHQVVSPTGDMVL